VTVSIDEKNTGEFKTCIENAPLEGFPQGWVRNARLGVTASTGQLADNHDIISLKTAEGDEFSPEKTISEQPPAYMSTGTPLVDKAIRNAAEREGKRLEGKLETMTHDIEHHLHALYEKLENTVAKLKKQESLVEDRLKELEDKVAARLQGQLDSKVDQQI